jgi:hypothetical protein
MRLEPRLFARRPQGFQLGWRTAPISLVRLVVVTDGWKTDRVPFPLHHFDAQVRK